MTLRRQLIVLVILLAGQRARADDVLYAYEGDVLPYDESAGWVVFDPCEDPCSDWNEDGHFVLHWSEPGDLVNYHFWVVQSPDGLPPTFWVEWRFRSNNPLGGNLRGCDGSFAVGYDRLHDSVYMEGDVATSADGGGAVFGLDIDEFHTYRFESLDGTHYRFSVDGLVFSETIQSKTPGGAYVQMHGLGGCGGEQPNTVNEWDFVRYGTIGKGEIIVATDPPEGLLNPNEYPDRDSFTVTFDQPNYVYIDDITVNVTGGDTPVVIQTLRLDNGDSKTVQIVLDRSLTIDQTTTFTFNDAAGTVADTTVVNVVEYTVRVPVPTVSAWGLAVLTLLILTAATILLRRSEVKRGATHLGWHGLVRRGRDRP